MNCAECGQPVGPPASTGRPRRYCSRSCQSKAYRRRRDQGRLVTSPGRQNRQRSAAGLLEAAVSLADAEGIEAVTLRSVAHRTGQPLASVQREFTSRDQLVAAMTQYVYPRPDHRPAHVEEPAEFLRHLARAEWAVYRKHPWLVRVLASTRPPLAPGVLDIARDYVTAFAALGADPEKTLGRYLALNAYVQGMALLLAAEQQETRTHKSAQSWWSDEISRLNRTGARPQASWIEEVSAGEVPTSADIDSWFHDGLTRIITGLSGDDATV